MVRVSASPPRRSSTSNHVGPNVRRGGRSPPRMAKSVPHGRPPSSTIETPVPPGSGATSQRSPSPSSKSATVPSFAACRRMARLPSMSQFRRVGGERIGSHSAAATASWSRSYTNAGAPARDVQRP
jgi:hypothetical protein